MKKEELIKLINQLPDGENIYLDNGSNIDRTQAIKDIKDIEYDEYNGVYIIK